jgi:hydrogenase nickel incorporation protein HypA/HybF
VHELSLCRSIYGIVDRARGDRPVEVVHLQIGQLRQVVPQTLAYCWDVITAETPLAGSRLDVDHVPVVLDCACGARTTVGEELVLTCAACDGADVTLCNGEELMVTAVDLTSTVPAGTGDAISRDG